MSLVTSQEGALKHVLLSLSDRQCAVQLMYASDSEFADFQEAACGHALMACHNARRTELPVSNMIDEFRVTRLPI